MDFQGEVEIFSVVWLILSNGLRKEELKRWSLRRMKVGKDWRA